VARQGAFTPEFQKKREDDLLSQNNTAKCALCDWTVTGELRKTRAAFQAHRDKHHPHMVQRTRRNVRQYGDAVVSNKTIDENIENVREQGGHRWA